MADMGLLQLLVAYQHLAIAAVALGRTVAWPALPCMTMVRLLNDAALMEAWYTGERARFLGYWYTGALVGFFVGIKNKKSRRDASWATGAQVGMCMAAGLGKALGNTPWVTGMSCVACASFHSLCTD